MDLSVAVVNWNSGAYLGRLLDCLAPLLPEVERVIVVDNASADDSVGEKRLGVVYRLLGENRGFAAAANLAIADCSSSFVLLLNPDIRVSAETVRELQSRVERQPRVAIGCPALIGEEGATQRSFQIRPLPSLWSAFADAVFLDEIPKRLRRRARPQAGDRADETSGGDGVKVEQPAAAFWLLRRAAWEELGGFDESFAPAWFEDVDFCRRLAARGWEAKLFQDLKAVHRGGVSLDVLPYADFIRLYYGNLLKYFRKHHPLGHALLWLPVKAGVGARLFLGRI
jgi:GT2 family glycosyltransferase